MRLLYKKLARRKYLPRSTGNVACGLYVSALSGIYGSGSTGLVTTLQAVGLAISIPGMLWLIPRWGILGAAVALLISTISRFALIYISFPLVLKTAAPDLRFKSEDAKSMVAIIARLAGAGIHPQMRGSS